MANSAQFGILHTFDHNLQTWKTYRGRITQYFLANDITASTDSTGSKRKAILLSALTEGTYKLATDLVLPKSLEDVPYVDLLNILDAHFTPKHIGFAERHNFYAAIQQTGETHSQWAARLRGLTEKCGFSNVEEALRDRFLMGMLPGQEKEKLYTKDLVTLSMAEVVKMAENMSCARAAAASASVPAAAAAASQLFKISKDVKNATVGKVKCSVCGYSNHKSSECRFTNYVCKKCHEKGHLRRMCTKKVNYVELECSDKGEDDAGDDGMMRRGSMAMVGVGGGEPLIVVEESGAEDTDSSPRSYAPPRGLSIDQESPPDPYHLSPWRDNRKHSLPTPACTSGPTASQVRRLSERGESAAKEAREAAFLATLSQVQPQPGGRRHSVVTISRVPQALFGRGRRESIAAFPQLARRRDSGSGTIPGKKCPPATDTLGSTHNLQLDIMDDILQARKVRMRLWNTSSERVCEVQPLDERSPMGSSVRYTNRGRRHSDFVGAAGSVTLPPIPSRRRASEMPPPIPPRSGFNAGVVCTDTDLQHMLTALTSSATEIDRCGKPERPPARRLADMRSSSFDASSLRDKPADSGTTWFANRHQTLATKKKENEPKKTKVTFADEYKKTGGGAAAVVWDKPTGSVVDASALGSAIEVFLRKSSIVPEAGAVAGPSTSGVVVKEMGGKGPDGKPKQNIPAAGARGERWFGREEETDAGCDPSLCSSLKDLFV